MSVSAADLDRLRETIGDAEATAARGGWPFAAQVVVEFWVVATRPREANGLGWDPPTARAAVDGLVSLFPMLPEAPEAFAQWLRLVTDGLVLGKRAHDVRLAAAALSNGVGGILTLNPADFTDLPGLAVLRVSTVG